MCVKLLILTKKTIFIIKNNICDNPTLHTFLTGYKIGATCMVFSRFEMDLCQDKLIRYFTLNNNTRNPLTAVLMVSFDSWSQFYLVYKEISYVYDVIYDLIQGEGIVSNCTTSYWSVLFSLVSHITIVYFE